MEQNFLLDSIYGCDIHSAVSAEPSSDVAAESADTRSSKSDHGSTIVAVGATRAAIRASLPSMQPADARVAQTILEDPGAAVYLTVTEVASRAKTSASTVVRACQVVGFRGFHDLKLALARDLGANNLSGGDIAAGDTSFDLLRKVLASDARAIADSVATVDPASFDRAVAAIDGGSSVLFVGVGTSAPLAQDAAYRFLTIGIDARAPADVHVQHAAAGLLRTDDVCFAISHTGSTRETVEAVASAKGAGATTIAISSFVRSPLADLVDTLLVAGGAEHSFRIEAMASRIGHLSVLDALFVAVAQRSPVAAQAALDEVGRTLSDHRY